MAKVTLPSGPTRLQKNMAAGDDVQAATTKATGGKASQPPASKKTR